MKSFKKLLFLSVILFACNEEMIPDGDFSLPEPDNALSPPSWLIGDWIDTANSTGISFETNNIRITAEGATTNFAKRYPGAHEDYKSKDLYHISINDNGIRKRVTFERKSPNSLYYTFKIMGTGPTIELIKR